MPRIIRTNPSTTLRIGGERRRTTKTKSAIFKGGLVLFFCLFLSTAFAAPPAAGSISPSAGSSAPNQSNGFNCIYTDADGETNLKELYLLISTSPTTLTKAAYVYYDQNKNLLYLRNDTNTAWLGGYAPGSNNIIENSSVKLNCALTPAWGIMGMFIVNYNLTFKPAFSGKKYNTYLKAVDDQGNSVNWTKKGTWTVNNKPLIVALTPSSGSSSPEQTVEFTTTYSDLDGWQNISYCLFLINDRISLLNSRIVAPNCFLGYYRQDTHKLYLRNDAGTTWLGGFTPGSANTIENSYAKINCSQTRVLGSANTLTIIWNVTFKPTFSGTRTMHLYVSDDTGAYQGWMRKGTWTVSGPDIVPPTGTVSINNDAPYTNSTTATLILSAQDNPGGSGVFQMSFSNESIIWSSPEPFLFFKVWTLAPGDGQKTVSVRFSDKAGNWSNPFTDTIILDSTPPTQPTVTLSKISATQLDFSLQSQEPTSGITEYQACVGTSKGSADVASWVTSPQSNFSIAVNLNKDQTYYITAKAKNGAGLWSEVGYSQPIKLTGADITPPQGTIKINGDSQYTNSTSVTLTLSAQDEPGGSGLSQMRFSNDNINWSNPEAYALSKSPWLLATGDGVKTVYSKFKDAAGNWSAPASDTIILDTAPPTATLLINAGDASTESTQVNLNISANDSGSGMGAGAQMKFSNDNSNWSLPEDYAATKSWKLSDGLGTKTVYARCKDVAGNWSTSVSDSISVVSAPQVPKERIFIYLNGKRIAMEENDKKFFYHNDHLGSTSVVTDESGTQVKYLEYQPYGETKVEEGSLSVKKKFTGKELDEETGLYDYGARQYEARLGRFISADTAEPKLENPQSLNHYSYCLNNPLRYTDPTGDVPLDVVLDVATTTYDVYQLIRHPTKTNWLSVGIDIGGMLIPYVSSTMLKGGIKAASKVNTASSVASMTEKASDIVKAEKQLERAKEAKTFSRFMTKAEAEAVEKTKLLRGGKEGKTFFTTNKYQTVKSAKSKLALETPPEVRVDFKIKNKPKIKGPKSETPLYGEPGGGIKLWTKDKVQVDIIRKRELR